jgi:hypothetical protein
MTQDVLKYLQPNAAVPIDMETTTMLVNALRQALESQEPVAWAMDYDIESVLSGFSTSLMGTAMRIESAFPKHRVKLLYTTPPQRTEQNFCSRCGKRTADLTHIHTCTPPQD